MLEFKDEPKKRHLRCPHCKSDDLAFVTEYHRAHALRFFETLCIAVLIFKIVTSLPNIAGNDSVLLVTLLAGISWFIFYTARCFVESKTHVQGICRTCGELWLLN